MERGLTPREEGPGTHRSHHSGGTTHRSGGTTHRSVGSHLHDEGCEDAAQDGQDDVLPGSVGGTLALAKAPSFIEQKVATLPLPSCVSLRISLFLCRCKPSGMRPLRRNVRRNAKFYERHLLYGSIFSPLVTG